MTAVLRWLGYIQPSHLPLFELLKFVLFANFSIVGMNVNLMWNSVGFYQIAKLSMSLVSCLMEVILDKVRYSRDTKLSISVVLLGVGVCTVTDVSVNTKGFIADFIDVWSTALQQYVSNHSFAFFFIHYIVPRGYMLNLYPTSPWRCLKLVGSRTECKKMFGEATNKNLAKNVKND
ncbi:hypothetical protein UlMin_020511 [Ulmus minor]